MSKKAIALCLSLFFCIGIAACVQGESSKRKVSEKLIDTSSWRVVTESFKVSPDSRRVAYVAQLGKIVDNKWFVVVDGKKEKQYDGIGTLIFSPDSRRVAYVALSGNKCFAVVDGKEEKQYGIGALIFSPDSRRVAYMAKSGNKQFVVVDGKEEKQYDDVSTLIFSPDSRRVAYVAKSGNKQFVVVNGKEGKQYDGIVRLGGGKIIFDTPISLHYLALKDKSIYLVEEKIPTTILKSLWYNMKYNFFN